MSGGHFDHAYFRVQTFAEELNEEIAKNDMKDGEGYSQGFPPEVIQALMAISAHADVSARLMKAAEWLYEGDTSTESFMKSFREILGHQD